MWSSAQWHQHLLGVCWKCNVSSFTWDVANKNPEFLTRSPVDLYLHWEVLLWRERTASEELWGDQVFLGLRGSGGGDRRRNDAGKRGRSHQILADIFSKKKKYLRVKKWSCFWQDFLKPSIGSLSYGVVYIQQMLRTANTCRYPSPLQHILHITSVSSSVKRG